MAVGQDETSAKDLVYVTRYHKAVARLCREDLKRSLNSATAQGKILIYMHQGTEIISCLSEAASK